MIKSIIINIFYVLSKSGSLVHTDFVNDVCFD